MQLEKSNLNTIGMPVKWIIIHPNTRIVNSPNMYVYGRIIDIDRNSDKNTDPPYLYAKISCSTPSGEVYKTGIAHVIELTKESDLSNLRSFEAYAKKDEKAIFYNNRLTKGFKEKKHSTTPVLVKKRLRVVHYPQIPCKPFEVDVDDEWDAFKIMNTLADQHLFLFENNFIGDYANGINLIMWDDDVDPDEYNTKWVDYWNEHENMEWEEFHQTYLK